MSTENRMSDVTRRNKRKSRRGCGRNQIGGNVGAGYAVVPTPVDPTHPFIGNSARIDNITSCRAQTPDYAITPPPAHGLPGMYGGKRRRGAKRKGSRRSRRHHRKQRGGAYTFNLTSEPVPIGAALSQGGYPEVQKLGCQGTITNPLNQGPHTGSNPTGPNSVNQWALGASIANKMSGGGNGVPTGVQNPVGVGSPYLDLKAIPGTPGGTGSPFLTSPTAGYDNKPSTWTDSVGAPVQLQIPYNARIMNPACIKTGGSRKNKSPRVRSAKNKTPKSLKKNKTPRSRSRRANRKH
jgi:hypothetical protein